MALLMPTAPMAAGLRRPTMMVSTMDMALQPSSESTTGIASAIKAPSSLRKPATGDACVTGARESMVLLTLTDGDDGPPAWGGNLCGLQIQDGKSNEARLSNAAIAICALQTGRDGRVA